jgi:hypothetical protein
MMGAQMTNGLAPHGQPAPVQPMAGFGEMQPAVTINQIQLTGRQIMALGSAVIGAIMSAYAGGWLFLPAKDSELKSLVQVVTTMQQQTDANRQAVERLTLAVDNLSGLVEGLGSEKPVVKRPLTRPVR